MGDGLFVDTVRGLKWSTISRISQQGLQYISTIILVGVLSPDDFGLMAMSMIVIGFLDIFKDFAILSQFAFAQSPEGLEEAFPGVYLKAEKASGEKCPRCWQWAQTEHEHHLCDRCAKIVG